MKIVEKKTPKGLLTVFSEKPNLDLKSVHQVHGNKVIYPPSEGQQADGIISCQANDFLAIKTADCLPILLEGESHFALIHAGWRGLQQEILMAPELRAQKFNFAYIGQSIRSCCFEVTSEFKAHFPQSHHFKESEGRLSFDLQQEAYDQLKRLDPSLKIEIAPECTCCDNRFHSYRRNQTEKRLWTIYQRIDL